MAKKIKMKSSSAARKRFTRSGGKNGKIKRAKAFRRHLLTRKSAKRKMQLRAGAYIGSSDEKRISLLIGS